jgi:hypothetical protein
MRIALLQFFNVSHRPQTFRQAGRAQPMIHQ